MSSDQSVNPFEDLPVVNGTSFDENSFAARLIQRGSNTDAPDVMTGRTLRPQELGWSLRTLGNSRPSGFLLVAGVVKSVLA